MQSNLLNILFIVLCCILPSCLFILIVTIMLARSSRARLMYAKEILENSDNPVYLEKFLPVPARYMPVYAAVSLFIIGFITSTSSTSPCAYHYKSSQNKKVTHMLCKYFG